VCSSDLISHFHCGDTGSIPVGVIIINKNYIKKIIKKGYLAINKRGVIIKT